MFESLQLHFYFWKFRTRMSRALAADAPAAPATANELSALVKLQTAYWQRHRPPTGAALQQALQTWNAQRVTAYVVSVRGHRVSLWDKPPSIGRSEQQQHEDRGYHKRAQLYQLFFEKALRQAHAVHPQRSAAHKGPGVGGEADDSERSQRGKARSWLRAFETPD